MPIAPSRSEPDVSAPWLLILRSSPYAGPRFGEAIDLALVAGVFERSLTVLLIDDAVQALRQSQHGEQAGLRTASKLLTALPEYDIDQVLACEDSLAQAGLADIPQFVQRVSVDDQRELIRKAHLVLND